MSGKHEAISKHTEKHAFSKIMIIIAIIAIIIIFIVFILEKYDIFNKKKKDIKIAVNNAFSALKNSDRTEAEKYIHYNGLIDSIDEIILHDDNRDEVNIEQELFKNVSWKIKKINTKDEIITIIVQVTNKDFKKIYTTWTKKIISENSDKNPISEKDALKKLKEIIQNETTYRTEIGKITLLENNEKYIIRVDDNLRNLLFPGIEIISTTI